MTEVLQKYIPVQAIPQIMHMIERYGVHLKIVNERKTRHGDYRKHPDGGHQITVNGSLNPYRFLMTLVHEIAHLVAFEKYGRAIKPHGVEWKVTFRELMVPFIRPEIYPQDVLPHLAAHFRNPKASSDIDARLSVVMKRYDPPSDKSYIFELLPGTIFLAQGKQFKLGNQRRKRYECIDLATGNMYLFQPNAQVDVLKENNEY